MRTKLSFILIVLLLFSTSLLYAESPTKVTKKEINFPKVTISTTIKKAKDGFDITLTSDVFARGVFLSTKGIDNFFSDNYFDLFPSDPITLHVTTPLEQKEFEKQLKIRTLSDAF